MSKPPILLASASPRRRELLKLLGIHFHAIATSADETPQPDEPAARMVERLSRLKAGTAQARRPDALIIAADTDVELDGAILGKPADAAEARLMLTRLRARDHSVYTAFTLAHQGHIETHIVHTCVWMRAYADEEIAGYVASGDPLDKAAAYGVQHPGFRPVERVDGCFANVMGLPLCRLYEKLAAHITVPPPALECIAHPERDCSVEPLVLGTSGLSH